MSPVFRDIQNLIDVLPVVPTSGAFAFGTPLLFRSCLCGDGILPGAGQSRHRATQCNARVAIVLDEPPGCEKKRPDSLCIWGRDLAIGIQVSEARQRLISHYRPTWRLRRPDIRGDSKIPRCAVAR
jgi:hypothetical protein